MKTFLLHHTPKTATQDTWAVSFSLPYIASQYARAGDGVWYVKTWLSAEQIAKRLAILFDDQSELRIHELSRKEASFNTRLQWLHGLPASVPGARECGAGHPTTVRSP